MPSRLIHQMNGINFNAGGLLEFHEYNPACGTRQFKPPEQCSIDSARSGVEIKDHLCFVMYIYGNKVLVPRAGIEPGKQLLRL